MFEWIDRESFKIKGKLNFFNFNALTHIAVYRTIDGSCYYIKATFSNGTQIDSGDVFDTNERAEESFKKFLNTRPSAKKNKIKIT